MTEEWTEGQTYGQTDRQTDRQTDTHTGESDFIAHQRNNVVRPIINKKLSKKTE